MTAASKTMSSSRPLVLPVCRALIMLPMLWLLWLDALELFLTGGLRGKGFDLLMAACCLFISSSIRFLSSLLMAAGLPPNDRSESVDEVRDRL